MQTEMRPLEATLVLPNRAGLHARSAALLVKTTAPFQCTITLHLDGRAASARSLIQLLQLGARRGDPVRVSVEGGDAEEALCEIKTLMENGFHEE
jgi:phosphotransferase system HPr (HPr) family protein